MAWIKGNYREAVVIYNEVQERLAYLGEKNLRSAVIGWLGLVAIDAGDLEQARAYLEQALATSRELSNTRFIANRLADLAYVFSLQGDREQYRQAFMECILLTRELYQIHKIHPLLLLLQSTCTQNPQLAAMALGSMEAIQKGANRPLDPVHRRYWDRVESLVRGMLGNISYETIFNEGKSSQIDTVLDQMFSDLEKAKSP